MTIEEILEYKSKLKACVLIRLLNEIQMLSTSEQDSKKILILEDFVEYIKNFEYKGE